MSAISCSAPEPAAFPVRYDYFAYGKSVNSDIIAIRSYQVLFYNLIIGASFTPNIRGSTWSEGNNDIDGGK